MRLGVDRQCDAEWFSRVGPALLPARIRMVQNQKGLGLSPTQLVENGDESSEGVGEPYDATLLPKR